MRTTKEDIYYLEKEQQRRRIEDNDDFDNDIAQKQIDSGFMSTEYS